MKNPRTITERYLAGLLQFLLAALSACSVLGAFPEPDVVLYGKVKFDGRNMTAADRVVIQARLIPMGASVTQAVLGELSDELYSLRIPIDSGTPVSRPGASVVGTVLYLTVLHNNQIRAQIPYEIRDKGLVQEVNFGDVDTDADGLPDGWEQAYLFGLQSPADGDPDGDGLKNSDEYRLGTHPMKVDAPHPADLSPRDNRITIAELSAYYNAWRTTSSWTLSPTIIPIEYVTRATYLWEQGEYYRQDLNPATGGSSSAPLWWVKVSASGSNSATPDAAKSLAGSGKRAAPGSSLAPLVVTAALPVAFVPGTPATVRYRAEVFSGMRTYAVEDVPPAGWRVLSVGDGGSYDASLKKVKWGPFFDRLSRELTYTVVPDRIERGMRFQGVGSYDGLIVSVEGQRVVLADPPLIGRFNLRSDPGAWAIEGPPGAVYRVEMSQDLASWSALTNGQADSFGRFLFGPAFPGRSMGNFVRAVEIEGETSRPVGW
jgi:hypothetical protein